MVDEIENRKTQVTTATGGFIAGGVVAAYFAQPLLEFADPEWLTLVGGLLAITCIWLWGAFVLDWPKRNTLITIVFGACALVGLVTIVTEAIRTANRNDDRCRTIEKEMLSLNPRRDDLPGLFDVLKCRPQTDELLVLPAPPVEIPTTANPVRRPPPKEPTAMRR